MAGGDTNSGQDSITPGPWRAPQLDPHAFERLPAGRQSDVPTVFDQRLRQQPAQPGDRNATMTLTYGDPYFDQRLAQGGKDILEIKNMPANVRIGSWADDKGLFFFFVNGADNKAHHYIPDGMQAITINQKRKDVDQMRAETYVAMHVPEAGGVKFPPLDQNTSAKAYGTAMTNLPDDLTGRMEQALAQGAQQNPGNPYFRLHLAELLTADAVRPVLDLLKQPNPPDYIDLNNTVSQVKINQAYDQLVQAEQAARLTGNPFALYQAQRSQVLLKALPAVLQVVRQLELP